MWSVYVLKSSGLPEISVCRFLSANFDSQTRKCSSCSVVRHAPLVRVSCGEIFRICLFKSFSLPKADTTHQNFSVCLLDFLQKWGTAKFCVIVFESLWYVRKRQFLRRQYFVSHCRQTLYVQPPLLFRRTVVVKNFCYMRKQYLILLERIVWKCQTQKLCVWGFLASWEIWLRTFFCNGRVSLFLPRQYV